MNIPHIEIKRESTWNGWCVHYKGFFKPGLNEGPVTHCAAGVEYASVEKAVTFTYQYVGDKHSYTSKKAHPCFKREHGLTDGCPSCRFPTPEEIKAHDDELSGDIMNMIHAHKAILAELDRRHKDGDATVKMNKASSSEYDEGDGPTNYVSGAGVIDCPVCKTGKLSYSRASYNGHVHARCSKKGCVSWMQ